MHRFAAFLIAFLFPIAAYAGPELCDAVAKEIDASLRAFQAPAEYARPSQRISIRNAVAQNPAAGLNYGSQNGADRLKGSAGGSPFLTQVRDNFLETDELKVFLPKNGAQSKACTIAGTYQIAYEVMESFCKAPSLCSDYPENLSTWAASLADASFPPPSLTRLAQAPAQQRNTDELPIFGAKGNSIVPVPFHFGGSEAWFAVKDDPRADLLRIGAAKEGPENMANWKTFTLAVLYKDGEPQASFVIEKRRGIIQRIGVFYDIAADDTPAAVVGAIYRTAAGISGDYSNGASVFFEPLAREHYMSRRLRGLLEEMIKRANGDSPELGFDPVTAGDPAVTQLKIAAEKESSQEASVLVDFQRADDPEHPVGNPQHIVLRYALVREDNAWKLDDIVAVKPNQWRVSEIAKGR